MTLFLSISLTFCIFLLSISSIQYFSLPLPFFLSLTHSLTHSLPPLLRIIIIIIIQNTIDGWTKGCVLLFPKKGGFGIVKNYLGITLTSISTKIYNALRCNRIEPKIEKILRKNQNGFQRNRSSSQILTIRRILEGLRVKNLVTTILFINFSKAFDSIHRGKMKPILFAYCLPKETVAAIMMRYKNTKVKGHSSDLDRLLRHCSRCAVRRHIGPISIYHLPRLRAQNVYWYNERLQFQAGKGKKQKIPLTNKYGCGLLRWHSTSGKYTHPSQNPAT